MVPNIKQVSPDRDKNMRSVCIAQNLTRNIVLEFKGNDILHICFQKS